jgi:hypothetical protein
MGKEGVMRPRFALLGSLLSALAVTAAPSLASAAPHHNRGLTITAIPNPIMAGEGVLIYGRLNGTDVAGKPIILYHHVSGSHRGFARVGATTTNAFGEYEFPRAEGVVDTNRSWFARQGGVAGVHSRTVNERVAALVSLSASATSADTRQPITFFGNVAPNHRFERVVLQEQNGSSDSWKTLKTGRLGPGSNYAIAYRWRIPRNRSVRVVFRGDERNIRGESDPISVTIQQAQVPDFTINSSSPVVDYGQSATLTGKLYVHGSTTPLGSTPIVLCHRSALQTVAICDVAGVTGADGSYGFNVSPAMNEVYFVQSTLPPHRHSARLFEGVKDLLALTANPSSATVGQPVSLTGAVTPDKAGDFVYLQRLGADGHWHTVDVSRVHSHSTFSFTRTFGTAGAKTLRARIPGDPENVGGASPQVTVSVSLPPLTALPPAS